MTHVTAVLIHLLTMTLKAQAVGRQVQTEVQQQKSFLKDLKAPVAVTLIKSETVKAQSQQ